jgi:hypothetical protein
MDSAMRALSNADFLTLWETGHRLHSLDRGLLAVRALLAEPLEESVADWPLGRRNQALAQLHSEWFGPELQGCTECDRCGEKLEFSVDCQTLIERQCDGSGEPIVLNGCAFRVPTSRDLARIAGECDPESAALRLLDSCRIEEEDRDAQSDAVLPEWSQTDLELLGEKMTAADPLAEIMLSFECPACKCARVQALDLPEFFWAELEAAAKRILREIHILAMTYGWSEREILSLSDNRRMLYLQMVQA